MISKITKTAKRTFENIKDYGLPMALAKYRIEHIGKKQNYLDQKKHYDCALLTWIAKHFDASNIIFSPMPRKKEIVGAKNIFILWFQGMENAPDLVKHCNKSMQAHLQNDQILHVLTMENLSDYLEIPSFVMEKHQKGLISFQHFSDIIRLQLLYCYGGVWLDALCFLVNSIPDAWFEKSFYSARKDGLFPMFNNQGRWVPYALAARAQSSFVLQVLSILLQYNAKMNRLIDYLLIDYAIEYVCNIDQNTNEIIYNVPTNCETHYELIQHLNDPYDEAMYQSWVTHTFFFKLSHKSNYPIDKRLSNSFYYRVICGASNENGRARKIETGAST